MQALKIKAEGMVTSFRYPHFMQGSTTGKQPSFEMPPPATIYGFICSAVGEWVDPVGLQFGYRFSYKAKVDDLESLHILSKSSGKLKGTNLPKVIEGSINPMKRELLFEPRLTLYLNRPEWQEHFRSPRYAVSLGRSQDLFTIRSVETVTLQENAAVYFEHTLLPGTKEMLFSSPGGYALLMPRMLDYENNRFPTFERYIVLQPRVFTDSDLFKRYSATPSFLTDPTEPKMNEKAAGIFLHPFC